MITISAFKWVPPFAQGLVRDLRARWALEEAGLPYQAKLIDGDVQKTAEYRASQPFGQVPMFEEDGFVLFESGSILLHVGARSEALLPADPDARARAITWVFAALNSVEPFVQAARRDRFVSRRQGLGEGAPAGRGEVGAAAAQGARRRARRPRPSGGPLYRRRSDDDGGAAHPASHRSGRKLSRSLRPIKRAARRGRRSSARWRRSWRRLKSDDGRTASERNLTCRLLHTRSCPACGSTPRPRRPRNSTSRCSRIRRWARSLDTGKKASNSRQARRVGDDRGLRARRLKVRRAQRRPALQVQRGHLIPDLLREPGRGRLFLEQASRRAAKAPAAG